MTSQPTLHSERLVLYPLSDEHLEFQVRLDAIPEVMRYITKRPRTRPEVEERFHIYRGFARNSGMGAWTVCWREHPQDPIGIAILKPLDGEDAAHLNEIEVGYRLVPAAWGQGVATEITRTLIAYGFDELGLSRIVGLTDTENDASGRVLEKAGLTRDGTIVYANETVPFYVINRNT